MIRANESGGMSSTLFFDSQAASPVPASDETVVLRNEHGVRLTAKVRCESFSAIAVAVDGDTFCIGDSVVVEYGEATIAGTVRRIDEQGDGSWILVVRWRKQQ